MRTIRQTLNDNNHYTCIYTLLWLLKEIAEQRIPAEAHNFSIFRPSFIQEDEAGILLQDLREMVSVPKAPDQLLFVAEEKNIIRLFLNYYNTTSTDLHKG